MASEKNAEKIVRICVSFFMSAFTIGESLFFAYRSSGPSLFSPASLSSSSSSTEKSVSGRLRPIDFTSIQRLLRSFKDKNEGTPCLICKASPLSYLPFNSGCRS